MKVGDLVKFCGKQVNLSNRSSAMRGVVVKCLCDRETAWKVFWTNGQMRVHYRHQLEVVNDSST